MAGNSHLGIDEAIRVATLLGIIKARRWKEGIVSWLCYAVIKHSDIEKIVTFHNQKNSIVSVMNENVNVNV